MNLLENSYRLINKYIQHSKTPKSYGTGDMLYMSEVHMIEVIGSYEGITTTKLAVALGITKGAVSQTVSKLEKKDMINKQPSTERTNEVFIYLSDKGRVVFENHRSMHSEMLNEINKLFDTMSEEGKQTIIAMINTIDSFLDGIGGSQNEI